SSDASASRPLHTRSLIASPFGDRRAGRRDAILRLELAASLHGDDVVLNDAVVALVFRDAAKGLLVDAQTPARDLAHFPILLVADRQREGCAVRRDRLDDQVEVLRLRILVGHAPDAGELAGPRHDAELVLALERGAHRAPLADAFLGRAAVAPLQPGLASIRGRPGLPDRGGLGREIDDRPMRNVEPRGEGFDLAERGSAHRELVNDEHGGDRGDRGERGLAPTVAPDVKQGERAAEPRLRRLVDEALLVQRANALLEDGVADLDALSGVDLAQPLFQRALAILRAELALDEPFAVAQRVD